MYDHVGPFADSVYFLAACNRVFRVCADMDVRRNVGDRAVFARWSYIPKEVAVQMAVGRERTEEELHPACRGVDGRLCQVLLRADWPRSGEYPR